MSMTTISLPAVAGGGIAAILADHPTLSLPVILCSIAGAALFTLIVHEEKVYRQCIYFFVSFITGLSGYEMGASMLSKLTSTTVPDSIGALVASTVAVTILTKLVEKAQNWKKGE